MIVYLPTESLNVTLWYYTKLSNSNCLLLFQGPMDLGDDYYSSFLFGGVNISAFGIIQKHLDTYKTWQILYSRHMSYYPNLFPLSVRYVILPIH